MGRTRPSPFLSGRDILTYVVSPLLGCAATDYLTQHLADRLDGPVFFGLIGLIPDRIGSYFLGIASDLPSSLINVVACSVAGFLTFAFVTMQWSVTTRSLLARLGASCVLGSILGHAAMRLANGHVVSFLTVGAASLHTPSFNLGDAYLMLGLAMIVAGSWRENGTIWPYREIRSSFTFWVNPRFQLRHCMTMVVCGLAFSAVLGGFTFSFLKGALVSAGVPSDQILHLCTAFLVAAILISASFIGVLFFVGLVQSHRIIGPLYAFERFLEDVFKGKSRKLKLRTGDEFRHLETLAEELEARLKDGPTRKSA